MSSLQSSEVVTEAGQPLRAISWMAEEGFQFRAKDSPTVERCEHKEAKSSRWRERELWMNSSQI